MYLNITFFVNSFLSIFMGMLIGVERQWRQKTAGLRTTALVSFGAFTFVALSGFMEAADPTRVAAQVVSGVGFLAGGVIIRDGYSVSGINTAATLWCSAAVGAMIGAGFPIEAVGSATMLIVANSTLRGVSRMLDSLVPSNKKNRYNKKIETKNYIMSITCLEDKEVHVRTVLLNILNKLNIDFDKITFSDPQEGNVIITTDLELNANDGQAQFKLRSLTEKLLMEKSVLEVNQLDQD